MTPSERCDHMLLERTMAVEADGYCPLCLIKQIAAARLEGWKAGVRAALKKLPKSCGCSTYIRALSERGAEGE